MAIYIYIALLMCLMVTVSTSSNAQIVISGFVANPGGTDGNNEYVQLVATQTINFATTPYSVVWANNGTATANGWAACGAVTYKFNLTSGIVNQGDVFYVGGSGKILDGTLNTTSLAGLNWIKTIAVATVVGDGPCGNANTGGVMGNGGLNADGIAVFNTTTVTSSTVPIDAVFYGTAVGTAKPVSGGYVVPTNDFYSNAQGTYGNGTNTFFAPDGVTDVFIKFTGIYNAGTNSWSTNRTASSITMTVSSTISTINSGITVSSGATPVISLSSPLQIAAGNLLQGALDQPVSHFQADVTVADAILTSLSFVTGNGGGSYSATDITNFKLFYNATSTTFGSAGQVQVGTSQAGVGAGSTVTFGSLTRTVANGASGNFWITASIAGGAGAGNKFNINASPTLTFQVGSPSGTITAGGNQTIVSATPIISLANGTIAAGNINQNSFNKALYRTNVSVSVTAATLDSVIFATTGTYSGSDLTNLRLWYSTVDSFVVGSSTLLATDTLLLGPGDHKFKPLSQLFPIGTGYLYVTATVPCTATAGATINVDTLKTSNFYFQSGTPTASSVTAGGFQTITEVAAINATSVAATGNGILGQVSMSWTNPAPCFNDVMIVASPAANTGGTPSGNSYSAGPSK